MRFTYFLSDVHLTPDRPDIAHCLTQFLLHDAPLADAVYVLGDLFEYWLGDDDDSPFIRDVARAFEQLVDLHVPVYFIHGNRDFLIGEKFAKRAGLKLLPERKVIDLYGVRTLLSHGDELCTMDVEYQEFRKKARGFWWPFMVKRLPLFVRRRIAENGRKKSQMNQQGLSEEITDVTPEEVVKAMETYQVQRFIHGHTHKKDIHHLKVNGQHAKRIVLGDWHKEGSVLRVTQRHTDLVDLPLDGSLRMLDV